MLSLSPSGKVAATHDRTSYFFSGSYRKRQHYNVVIEGSYCAMQPTSFQKLAASCRQAILAAHSGTTPRESLATSLILPRT